MQAADLKIAYIILAHKNPEQVNLFLQQLLSDEQADIYIHLDRNSADSMTGKIMQNSRITITKKNVSCAWGDISLVDATLILLREVIDSGRAYDFICLRSGQDMMTGRGFKEYLDENREMNFFLLSEIKRKSEEGAHFYLLYPQCMRKLYESLHPYRILRTLLRKLYGLGINVFPNKEEFDNRIRIFGGSQWFSMSMKMARYIVDYLDKNTWYYKAFRDVYIPDTIFFNTLVMNSPFKGEIINKSLTFQYNRQICKVKNHPMTLVYDDIEEIESSGCYFARKFDIDEDKKVLEYFMNKITG